MKVFNRIIRRLRRNKNEAFAFISTVVAKCAFHANDIIYGANLQVRGKLYIDNAGTVVVGDNVTINSANWANAIGGGNRTELQIRGGYSKSEIIVGSQILQLRVQKESISGKMS